MTDIVQIGLQVDSSDVRNGTRDLDGFGRQARHTERSTDRLRSSLKRMFTAMAAYAIAKKAIGVFAEFETAIKELSAITGATGKDLEFYKKQSLDMAKATGFAASETVKAFKLIASAKPDLLENKEALASVTKEVLTLARAASIDLETAADALGSTLNQFGADASEAGRFINVLAAGSKLGASEVGDMAEAMRVAGTVASTVGLSFEETNAALQAMAAMAIKGSYAGTGLRGVLLKLSAQANDDFNPSIVGLAKAMQNLSDANLTATEKEKLFGLESIVTAEALMKQADSIGTLTRKLTGTNIAYEQAATNSDTLEIKIAKMKTRWDELAITTTEKLIPALNGLITLGEKLAGVFGVVSDIFYNTGTAMGEFAAKVVLGLQGTPAYYIKAAKAAETLEEKIAKQGHVVETTAAKLASSMRQYEELTKHIDALSGVTGVSSQTMETLRAKQAQLKTESEKYAEALKVEKAALDELNASKIITIDIGGDGTSPGAGPTQAELDAQAEAQQLALELEQIYLDERLAMESHARVTRRDEEAKLLEDLARLQRKHEAEELRRQKAIDDKKKEAKRTFWGDLIGLTTSKSKALFEIGKAASLAHAVVDGYAAATSAWKVGMMTGPWTAAAYAAASVAKTAGLISSISSSSFGGGGGGGMGGGGGSIPTAPPAPTAPAQQAPAERVERKVADITVQSGLHTDEDVRNLIMRINDVQEDMGEGVMFRVAVA